MYTARMDTARYVIALLTIISFPPVLVFWFLIHPFVSLWRRAGLVVTYAVTLALLAAIGTTTYLLRDRLLAVDFGTNSWLVAVGVAMMIVATTVDTYCKRLLKPGILVGLPELRSGVGTGRLLQEGAYAWVRHPRYLAGVLIALSIALFANHLATWVLAVVCVPLLYLVTLVEERELVDRFGEQYRVYQRHVPRLIPRSLPPR